MRSILVGHSYFLRLDPKQLERAKPYPPLATLQVAATLRESGARGGAVRRHAGARGCPTTSGSWPPSGPQVVVLYEDNFNFLTKMCLAAMREACCQMIARGPRARRAGHRRRLGRHRRTRGLPARRRRRGPHRRGPGDARAPWCDAWTRTSAVDARAAARSLSGLAYLDGDGSVATRRTEARAARSRQPGTAGLGPDRRRALPHGVAARRTATSA